MFYFEDWEGLMKQDILDFRRSLGRFTTGICIAATSRSDGTPTGLTINSFNSVSLDPPLVLWSVGRHTASCDDFLKAEHFTISVLSSQQLSVSNRFARPGDKFADVHWFAGETGIPIISDAIASFECETTHQYEGGDHVILVGRVLHHKSGEGDPLLYSDGRYGLVQTYPDVA